MYTLYENGIIILARNSTVDAMTTIFRLPILQNAIIIHRYKNMFLSHTQKRLIPTILTQLSFIVQLFSNLLIINRYGILLPFIQSAERDWHNFNGLLFLLYTGKYSFLFHFRPFCPSYQWDIVRMDQF